ncbi:MAG: hypothetical protein CBC12_00305 [Candidatus Puniceispirillum sp. TMED52]|nr:MAG: hypothetical protein CBC12_00305 [Candidatus Puniceispirillum sp. TMED52]
MGSKLIQNALGRRLFKALFYLAFLAFVLIHRGIVISLLSHPASREWMEALSYLFGDLADKWWDCHYGRALELSTGDSCLLPNKRTDDHASLGCINHLH